jgi:hypothetical protein
MCDAKDAISFLWSTSADAQSIAKHNKAIRAHMAGCATCQAEQAELRQAAAKLAARLQGDDGAILAEEVS